METCDTGKPIEDSEGDIDDAIDYLRYLDELVSFLVSRQGTRISPSPQAALVSEDSAPKGCHGVPVEVGSSLS